MRSMKRLAIFFISTAAISPNSLISDKTVNRFCLSMDDGSLLTEKLKNVLRRTMFGAAPASNSGL